MSGSFEQQAPVAERYTLPRDSVITSVSVTADGRE